MKKLLPFVLCSTAAALCLGAVSARAGLCHAESSAGREPGRGPVSCRPALTPNGLPTVRTVTTVNDDGPGSLRQAIAASAPGDSINFALTLPATIVLSNTLVIAQDLTVLGPGPDKLTVMRSARHEHARASGCSTLRPASSPSRA